MPGNSKDLFSRLYQPTDRKAISAGIEEFLTKGGKVTRLKDSIECEEILKRRKHRQVMADRRSKKENQQGVIGGIPLTSNLEAITVKE